MIRRPPRSPLFPSPPLFRSSLADEGLLVAIRPFGRATGGRAEVDLSLRASWISDRREQRRQTALGAATTRSEEHTSELQSRLHLVCRLLLEKKKKKYCPHGRHLRHSPRGDPRAHHQRPHAVHGWFDQ